MRTTALISGLVLVTALLAACDEKAPKTPIPDTELSIYPGSVFEVPTPPDFTPFDTRPGDNTIIVPMFEGAPPQIPHVMEEFLPIDLEDNGCIECHLLEAEEGEDAPLLPESHRMDLRQAPPERLERVAGARWICTACHVRSTDAKPLPQGVPQD